MYDSFGPCTRQAVLVESDVNFSGYCRRGRFF